MKVLQFLICGINQESQKNNSILHDYKFHSYLPLPSCTIILALYLETQEYSIHNAE